MKKSLVIIAIAFSIISCNKTAEVATTKTAYVDTSKLMIEYTEAKDIEAKYKAKSQEMGKELEIEIAKFKAEAGSFQKNAQMNGQAWAQQKGAELQQREQQILQERDQVLAQIQTEGGKLQDTLIKQVKKYIKDFGKKEKFDYIFTTSEDAPSVIYAKDSYNLTDKLLKELNDQYKSTKEKK